MVGTAARRVLVEPGTRAVGAVSEFFRGFATLFRGFGWWRKRPGLMLLGLLPALIVITALVLLALVVAGFAEQAVTALTPFADAWAAPLRDLLRIALAIALLLGVVFASVAAFTALTLIVGDPFYERIWRAVETDLGGLDAREGPGFWRAVADGLRVMVRALIAAIVLALIALIPVVGSVLSAVLGVVFSGRMLALELTARPLEARGMRRPQRRALLRTRPARTTGFGVAVQLCFLVPGGAIVVMPAAVAGGVHLARELLAEPPAPAPPTPGESAPVPSAPARD
ncbi:MAG: EI24 domain-containing protein [Microbacteriaceae bacterium]|nr:EI24 domain-containing protein [Microbacteriaceae bacterium]